MWANEAHWPIEALLTGGTVASRHDETYADAPQAITRIFGRLSPEYYRLTTEFDTLEVTPEHPFYVQGRGWTQAKDIEAGQALVTVTGDVLVHGNTRIAQPLRVYNFSVATTPSYFVGKAGVWVHNAKCVETGAQAISASSIKWKGFSKGKLKEHYDKHVVEQKEFGEISQAEYLKLSKEFASQIGEFQEANVGNFVVKYDPSSRRVLIGHMKDRELRTFYKDDGRSADPFQDAINLALALSEP